MKKWLQKYGWALYFSLAIDIFGGLSLTDWEFYAILVPLVILVPWSQER